MENCSSGEDQILKARKPYTITKQRERWTDEEHNRFLEALKLYGRAWQRIEEHIGTKTAVQIRSHAQKFFTKLEKEAASKGIPMEQAFDIDIPPPRPKRKPNNPYPRKISTSAASLREEQKEENQSESDIPSCTNTETVQLKDDALMQELVGRGHTETEQDLPEYVNCPDVVGVIGDASFASGSSLSRCSQNQLVFREFIPLVKEMKGGSAICETSSSYVETENKKPKECCTVVANLSGTSENLLDKVEPLEKPSTEEQLNGAVLSNEMQETQKNTKRAPTHPSHENNEAYESAAHSEAIKGTSLSNEKAPQFNRDQLKDASVSTSYNQHTSSSVSSIHQQLPCFPPLAYFCNNQDGHKSIFNISSTFSSFVISALLQNPAAHAAANIAASFWPGENEKNYTDFFSGILDGRIPQRHENSSPSIAAIAAATVAAATAWWATHGLLHLCHPPFPASFGYTFPPVMTTSPPVANPVSETNQISEAGANREAAAVAAETVTQQEQQCDPESAEALFMEHSASRSSPMASSDSDESEGAEQSHGLEQKTCGVSEPSSAPRTDVYISEKNLSSKRKRDCQFLVTSVALGKQEQENTALENVQESGDQLESVYHHEFGENFNSRLRNIDAVNESWKEVPEEGRIAFHALFSREVLPQSFSGHIKNYGMTVCCDKSQSVVPDNFNTSSRECIDLGCGHVSYFSESNSRSDHHLDTALTMGKCTQNRVEGNLKGFKPYKRCSMEARESGAAVRDESNNKRINVEGKSSTQ